MTLLRYTEFYKDLDKLYIWMDEAVQMKCKKDCNFCCTQDIIWLTVPELLRMYGESKPQEHPTGCPYQTKTGCGAYKYRPLVCRSFGPSQYVDKKLNVLSVFLGIQEYSLAGPGVCDEPRIKSQVNIADVNQIYACYAMLTQTGLVAMGSCADQKTQEYQENLMNRLQLQTPGHRVYAKNGIPHIF